MINNTYGKLEKIIDFPETDEDLGKTLFTGVDDTEEQTISNNSGSGGGYRKNTDLKCIYSITYNGDSHLAIRIPLFRIEKKTIGYTLQQTVYTAKVNYYDYGLFGELSRWSDYIPKKDFCSKYLNQYVKEIIFEKCSAMRYKVTIVARFPNFGHEKFNNWRNEYKTEIQANSLEELKGLICYEDLQTEYNGITKQVVLKMYEDFTAAGIKVSVNGAKDFKELTAPSKKNKTDKLMTLKINSRVIAYDKFKKAFVCRVGKENADSSEFDDTLCKSIVREASVHICFDNSQYSDAVGFSYTLKLVSNDAPKQLKQWYGGAGAEDGVTQFYCVEDENIFDIVRKFRELGIPTSLTGVKKLLNIYERTKRLADIINEDFPEDVLMAQIGEEGIKF